MYEYKIKEITKVVDGDTVDIILDLGFGLFKKERVRIAGIDTPEKRTSDHDEKLLGYDATHYAEEWFGGDCKEITVKTSKDGKYGRMLGWFYKGEECYNKKIVEDGYAWAYDGGTKIEKSVESYEQLLKIRGFTSFSEYKSSKDD